MHVRRQPQRRRAVLATAALGLSSVLLAIGPADATLSGGSTFESGDGNLSSQGLTDWNTLPTSALNCVEDPATTAIETKNCGLDKPTGQGDDSFGQGTSEDTPVPSVVDGSIPNNKSDLTRFYVAKEFAGGKNFLYLAWERVQEPTGTTNMDFEFNQSRTLSSNGVTPVRTAGDLLINYDLSQGGTNPSLGYRTWLTTSAQPASAVCEATNRFPCWSDVNDLTGFFEGAVNTATLTDGDTIPPGAPRSLTARTFGEAGIDLTGSGILPTGTCTGFGRAYLKSRSSDSFTSALKDFIAPIPVDINNCAPAELKIKKVDASNTATTLAGAVFQLYKDNPSGGTAGVIDATDTKIAPDAPSPSTATTCTTTSDGIGNCVYTLLAAAASNGLYIAREVTAPAGYNGAPDQTRTVTITATASTYTFVFQDAAAPGTVTVTKLGAPNATPLGGAVFKLVPRTDLTTTEPTTAERAATGTSCTTVVTVPPADPPAGGQGSCSFTNVALGDYWLIEVTPPANYFLSSPDYQAVTVGLGSSSGTGQTVTKTFTNQPKLVVITVVCNQATGTLDAGSATLDGETKATLTTATLANATLEAQVCALGGARFTDKANGVQLTGSVTP